MPMLAVLTVLLTRVVNEEQLLKAMAVQAQHFAPANASLLPYAFVLVLGVGLLALTLLFSLINAFYEAPGLILYLISFVGVFILLLGAQVIAELERSERLGLRWYVSPG
jgi:polyferredoxin